MATPTPKIPDRVAAINATIASQGNKGFATAPNPTGGGNAVTSSSSGANPHDLPSYNPVEDLSSSVNLNPNTQKTVATPVDTSQPSPQTAKVTAPNAATPPAIQATPDQVKAVADATQTVNSLSQQYKAANSLANKSGLAPLQSKGGAASETKQFLDATQGSPPASPAIKDFLNPENPLVQDSTKQLMEWLNPQADKQMLNDHIAQLSADRSELAGLKTDLMNMKRVMAGTEQDLRDEVTKAGGFATESQVQALTIARNKSLIQKAQLISDQIQSQTDLVNSDISLVGEEKQMAAQQFTQRMSLLNYQQENTKNSFNAAKDAYQNIVNKTGYQGLYQSLANDPTRLAQAEQILGLGSGGLHRLATAPTPRDLQFVSGTENQPMGVFDKSTGKFTQLGGGGGSGGGVNDIYTPQNVAYAQQYAETGQIPTGLPKGTFGDIAQIAKELPKTPGQILSASTGVSPAGDATLQNGISALYSATQLAQQLKELDKNRWGGLVAGTLGKVTGSEDQSKYVNLRNQVVDLIARARSGAALTPSEEERYGSMLPGRFSNPLGFGQDTQTQIDSFINTLTSDAKNKASANGWVINGLSDVKIGGQTFKVGDIITNEQGHTGRINADGSITLQK